MSESKTFPKVSFFTFLKRSFEIVKNPLPFHSQNFKKHGDTFILKIGFNNEILFSRDAGFLKYALQKNQKNFTKSEVQTKDVAKYLGKGLLTSEGDFWKKQRKLIQPTFHKKKLNQLLETMQQTIKEELATIPTDTKINIEPYFGKLAFQVVAKALFSGGVEEAAISQLQHAVEASQKMLVRELRQPYLKWWFSLSGLLEKHYQLVREAREMIRELIIQRRQEKQSIMIY